MTEVKYVKLQTQTQRTFQEFIDGKHLPASACEHVMTELSDGKKFDPYERIVSVVKNRLRLANIHKREGVLFVDFKYLLKEQERPVLIRVLNMIFGTHNFIVVNMEEVVYIPAGCKNNQSLNELSGWLTQVADRHAKEIKRKSSFWGIFDFLKSTETTEVNLSIA